MGETTRWSRAWRVVVAAIAVAGLPLLTAPTAYQLALVAVSTAIAGAIILATTIAVTGRNIW